MSAATSGAGAIVLDARYVRERPSGIGVMVDELVRRLPRLLPTETFVFLRHPRARSPLSDAPNATDFEWSAEANGPATLFGAATLAPVRTAALYLGPFNLLPFGLRCASIVTVHDLMWLDSPELCRSAGLWGGVETAFYGAGIRSALRSATALLAPSHATKAAIAARSPEAGARTTVVPHGVDDAFLQAGATALEPAAQAAVRTRYVPGARRYVLTVGQAAGYKNHRGVVKAFAQAFPGAEEGTHLVLVQRLGDGSKDLLGLADLLGLRGRVHVLATVPFADLVRLYQGALCLCHPSFVEGWGMPLTEAMAAGCPVLTSSTSCMPEVTAGAAELVDPRSVASIAKGLRCLGSDEARRSELRTAGLARARELSWERHAARTADVIAGILRPPRPR